MPKIGRKTAMLMAATAIVTASLAAASQAPAAQAPPYDYSKSERTAADKALPNPYLFNNGWYQMPAGRFLGGISGIEIDAKDGKSIWVVERCGGRDMCVGNHVAPVIHYAPDGRILGMFGADEIAYPHGLHVDKDNNIWVTDLQSNMDPAARNGRPIPSADGRPPTKKLGATVTKYSPAGRILLTLGTPGEYGSDGTHFSQPSDVITSANGDIFVADAHDSRPSNDRIAKFDRTGKFIKEWKACKPADKAQMDCAHALAFDSKGQLYVGNRGNNAVDVYDQDGNFLKTYTDLGKPSGLSIDKDDIIYVSDSQSGTGNGMRFVKGVHIADLKTGQIKAFLPDPLGNMSPWSGPSTLSPEGVAVDKDGIIYTSQVNPPGIGKWTLSKTTRPFPLPAGQ